MNELKLKEVQTMLHDGADKGHIGMYNCNKRLMLTFGNEAQWLKIKSHENKGTSIHIFFPRLPIEEYT